MTRFMGLSILSLLVNVYFLHQRVVVSKTELQQQRKALTQETVPEYRLEPPPQKSTWKPSPTFRNGFSACLLIKDDNDLLNEWLAYHTHVLDLRYLVVAVDPSSETSPTLIFDRWRNLTDIEIIEWTDETFMPKTFLEKGYHEDPNQIVRDAAKSQWHEGNEDAEKVWMDNLIISNHRFRQITFVSRCLKHIKDKGRSWTMHIDTDEFVTVNPFLRNTTQRNVAMLRIGPVEEPYSLLKVLQQVYNHKVLREKSNHPCISMPRLLFGSVEFPHNSTVQVPPTFDVKAMETQRWQYHTDFEDDERNAQPKVIIDVSHVHPKDDMFSKPFSIHRPSRRLCRSMGTLNFRQLQRFPLTVNHYTGSYERYFSKNDTRRSARAYNFKAKVSAAHDDWLAPWIHGFVQRHGLAKAKLLLREHVLV